MHLLSNQYILNHSMLLASCRWIYGPALCVMGADCCNRMTLTCHLYAQSQTLLSFPIVSTAKSLFKKSDRISSQMEDFTPGNSQLYLLSFSCLYLGYFIAPCNPILPHGYLCLKCLKLERSGTEGVQNPSLALTCECISPSVYA